MWFKYEVNSDFKKLDFILLQRFEKNILNFNDEQQAIGS